ncbi:MAG: Na(+)-translocating NADH-quinone reductase subunit A [Bacteroidales bacterium]|nr:Na(+)-translocating NADH-quinone reductase subunit A [Bacteroidales bacterium]
MSNNIDLKKGLNIPIKGSAKPVVSKTVVPDTVAIVPSDFKGLVPRLLVKEGDRVLAGSPVLADKKNPDILVTSPVSGTVKEIVRGEKRKLLEVLIGTDSAQEYLDFGCKRPESLGSDEVKTALLQSGLWAAIVQRPYGILADPAVKPKAIFISAFNTAPLAADTEFVLGDDFAAVQAGVNALSKLTDGGVHVSLKNENYSSTPFHKLEHAILHTFSGKHPVGNVGVQISHIAPIQKDETVWTVSLLMVAAIGKLFLKGRYDLTRKVAVCGPAAVEPSYVETVPGMPVKELASYIGEGDVRIISGDILTGRNVGKDGFLGFFDNQVTLLKEGTDTELFGWAKPFRFNQFSSTRSYFSWLLPNKEYDMDTNLHGGPRAFVMSDSYYADVLPMDIYPLYLVKACLAGDIDKMEQFGIYEVLPEDLALCEYIDPSKNYIQDIVQRGIDLMIQEMA